MGAENLNLGLPYNHHKFAEFITGIVKESLDSIVGKDFSKTLSFASVEEHQPVYSNWISLILLNSKEVELLFAVHFDLRDIQRLTSAALEKPLDSINERVVCFDVLKELCNTVAGYARNKLSSLGIESGFSLPMLAQGFDQIILGRLIPKSKEYNYTVSGENIKFLTQYQVHYINNKKLQEINFNDLDEEEHKTGVVELL